MNVQRLSAVTALLVVVTLATASGVVAAKSTVSHAGGWDSIDNRLFYGGEFNIDASQTQVSLTQTQVTVTVPAGKMALLRANIEWGSQSMQGTFRAPCPSGSVMYASLTPSGPFAGGHMIPDDANGTGLIVNADKVFGPGSYTFGVDLRIDDASSCPNGTATFNLPSLSVTIERAILN